MATRNKNQLTRSEQLAVYKHTFEQELNEQDAPILEEWTVPSEETESVEDVKEFLQARGAKEEHIQAAIEKVNPSPLHSRISESFRELRDSHFYKAAVHALGRQGDYYAMVPFATNDYQPDLPQEWRKAVDVATGIGWTIQTIGWAALSTIAPGAWQLPVLANSVSTAKHGFKTLFSTFKTSSDPDPIPATTTTSASSTRRTLSDLVNEYETTTLRDPYTRLARRITDYTESRRSYEPTKDYLTSRISESHRKTLAYQPILDRTKSIHSRYQL